MTTAQDIWDRALDYADMTDSSFPDSDQLLNYVNSALSDIHYGLADAAADAEWHSESVDIDVVADTGSYDLPDGALYSAAPKFYKLLGLWRVENDVRFPVPKFQRSEVSGYRASPSRDATLVMEYIPTYTNLTSADDDIDAIYPPQWEDVAAMSVAERLLMREESFEAMKALASLRAEKFGMMARGVSPRDMSTPERIEDVTGRWGAQGLAPGTPWFCYRIEGSQLVLAEPAPNAAYFAY